MQLIICLIFLVIFTFIFITYELKNSIYIKIPRNIPKNIYKRNSPLLNVNVEYKIKSPSQYPKTYIFQICNKIRSFK